MFRALKCPSSGGQIVLSQHLVLSLCTVQYSMPDERRLQSAPIRHTEQPFTGNGDSRCCDNTICPPEDGHVNARNMSRIVM